MSDKPWVAEPYAHAAGKWCVVRYERRATGFSRIYDVNHGLGLKLYDTEIEAQRRVDEIHRGTH